MSASQRTARRVAAFAAAACLIAASACDRTDLSQLDPGDALIPPPVTGLRAEKIKIVGSSTVAPFATTVAERFGATSAYPTPIVETTGTGGGFKAFCRGTGLDQPSIADASRPLKDSERALCAGAGVTDLAVFRVGYDGIVIANAESGPDFDLTKAQIYLALADQIPGPGGGFIANPYTSWSDIDAALPDEPILVFGPPPTSGTRDAFVELGMEAGAEALPVMAALKASDEAAFKDRAHTIRTDGAWIDFGENDAAVVLSLTKSPAAIGILGFSFLEQNRDRVKAGRLAGVDASFDTIKSGQYGLSRLMFVYVKEQNIGLVPGLAAYIGEFVSDEAMGPDGYLLEKGLIPLSDEDRAAQQAKAAALGARGIN